VIRLVGAAAAAILAVGLLAGCGIRSGAESDGAISPAPASTADASLDAVDDLLSEVEGATGQAEDDLGAGDEAAEQEDSR